MDEAIWAVVHRHLRSVFSKDVEAYQETTDEALSLYEWFVTPHRLDGLDFHRFMIEGDWAGAGEGWRYDLLEPRLQVYGETAVASYTFLLTRRVPGGLEHLTHNESRVLVRRDEAWKVVHVHKSPAWRSPIQGPPG